MIDPTLAWSLLPLPTASTRAAAAILLLLLLLVLLLPLFSGFRCC